MPRVFIPSAITQNETLNVRGDASRYINNVLRLKRGASIVIFDASGEHFDAVISSVSRGSVELSVGGSLGNIAEPAGGVSLVMGVIKGQKMDTVIQKAVELGVSSISPVFMERSVVRDTRKHGRWLKVALEAARQCGRCAAPPVNEPRGLPDFLDAHGRLDGVVFYEDNEPSPVEPGDVLTESDALYVVVGPEGGITPAEIELMRARGLKTRSLGRNILRADTAAIASVALIQYLLGRLA